jgi:hypothetical protein
VQVTGSRINPRDLQPGTYLSHTVTFSEQVTAVFLLETAPDGAMEQPRSRRR